MFAIDQAGLVSAKMNNHVLNERLRYASIYDLVEDYMVEANTSKSKQRDTRIMIGGSVGVNLLLERSRTYLDFHYELYTEDSLIHANSLTNAIAKHLNIQNNWVTKLKTSVPDVKYDIFVDNRLLITIYTLRSDPVKTYDLIEPVEVKSFDGKRKLFALSPEMQLLNVYRTLSTPAESGMWMETLANEELLYTLLKKRLSILGGNILGGRDELTTADRSKVENALLSDFVANNNKVVLLGEHAIRIIKRDTNMSSNVINVITDMPEEESFAMIRSVVHKALGREIPVTKQTRSPNIMQDFRLTRTTIKIGADSQQKEVMYIYNSASFELIPFNSIANPEKKSIQVANPFILMRFLLIDLWMIRWVREMKKVNEFFAKKRIHNILSLIVGLRTMMALSETMPKLKDGVFANENDLLNVFQHKRYVGTYISEMISVRLKQLHSDKRYFDYFPQGYFFKNKAYRIMY
jgi:hypothetical protein